MPETELFNKKAFPNVEVIHHGRPAFLQGQEFDVWLPGYRIAVKYQGTQHYEVFEHWGGEEGLMKRKELGRRKKEESEKNNVHRFYVKEGYNFDNLFIKIKTIIDKNTT